MRELRVAASTGPLPGVTRPVPPGVAPDRARCSLEWCTELPSLGKGGQELRGPGSHLLGQWHRAQVTRGPELASRPPRHLQHAEMAP